MEIHPSTYGVLVRQVKPEERSGRRDLPARCGPGEVGSGGSGRPGDQRGGVAFPGGRPGDHRQIPAGRRSVWEGRPTPSSSGRTCWPRSRPDHRPHRGAGVGAPAGKLARGDPKGGSKGGATVERHVAGGWAGAAGEPSQPARKPLRRARVGQDLWRHPGVARGHLPGGPGRDRRHPGPQRRRQDHHPEDHRRAPASHRRPGSGRRGPTPIPRPGGPWPWCPRCGRLRAPDHLGAPEFIARAFALDGWQPEAEALLRRYHLWEKRDVLAATLSKGQRQKLLICGALLHQPGSLSLRPAPGGAGPGAPSGT